MSTACLHLFLLLSAGPGGFRQPSVGPQKSWKKRFPQAVVRFHVILLIQHLCVCGSILLLCFDLWPAEKLSQLVLHHWNQAGSLTLRWPTRTLPEELFLSWNIKITLKMGIICFSQIRNDLDTSFIAWQTTIITSVFCLFFCCIL